jgi:hypothetical protein
MTKRRFSKGDHVSWNSEAGRVRGKITKVVTSAVMFKGYIVHASKQEPQYEIKSDKTDHIAMHKGLGAAKTYWLMVDLPAAQRPVPLRFRRIEHRDSRRSK